MIKDKDLTDLTVFPESLIHKSIRFFEKRLWICKGNLDVAIHESMGSFELFKMAVQDRI